MHDPRSASSSIRSTVTWAVLVAVACTVVARVAFAYVDLADVVMVYLVGVVFVSTRFGLRPSVVTALLSIVLLDFFFVPPYYTLAVRDLRHVVTFGVMFLVAVVIGTLTERLRVERTVAEKRADEAERVRLEIERARAETLKARNEAETERLRSGLLSSVSHDLRTPLAIIQGAATTIRSGGTLTAATHRDLVETIVDESARMARLVGNLVEMTRVESGHLAPRCEPHSIEEVIGGALTRMEKTLADRPIRTSVPSDLPLVSLDPVLIEQVLLNLLDNAVRHTPRGTPISVSAGASDDEVVIEVADEGPGLVAGTEERVFEKFFRTGSRDGGMGLGLAICRAIATAHTGRISASNRASGGAVFRIGLPMSHGVESIDSTPDMELTDESREQP